MVMPLKSETGKQFSSVAFLIPIIMNTLPSRHDKSIKNEMDMDTFLCKFVYILQKKSCKIILQHSSISTNFKCISLGAHLERRSSIHNEQIFIGESCIA